MVRVVIAGATGRVGRAMMTGLRDQPGIELVGGFGSADAHLADSLLGQAEVLVDFTRASSAPELLLRAARAGVRPVSGTTGLRAAMLEKLDGVLRDRGIGGVWATNFALGAALTLHFAAIAARFMDAAEIVELHHDGKADAPSGTAVQTAHVIREARGSDLPDPPVEHVTLENARGAAHGGVRIHSVRLPGLFAHQEVIFGAQGETLTLRHDTSGRDVYVPGVALAAQRVMDHVGLVRGLSTLMGLP